MCVYTRFYTHCQVCKQSVQACNYICISMHIQVLYMNIQVNSTANKATVTGCIWYVLCTITVETHQDKL